MLWMSFSELYLTLSQNRLLLYVEPIMVAWFFELLDLNCIQPRLKTHFYWLLVSMPFCWCAGIEWRFLNCYQPCLETHFYWLLASMPIYRFWNLPLVCFLQYLKKTWTKTVVARFYLKTGNRLKIFVCSNSKRIVTTCFTAFVSEHWRFYFKYFWKGWKNLSYFYFKICFFDEF